MALDRCIDLRTHPYPTNPAGMGAYCYRYPPIPASLEHVDQGTVERFSGDGGRLGASPPAQPSLVGLPPGTVVLDLGAGTTGRVSQGSNPPGLTPDSGPRPSTPPPRSARERC